MTDEEADALDEKYTRIIPKVDTSKPGNHGFFTENRERIVFLDEKTVRYIKAKAEALHQTPAELVADLVRRDLAASN
jgi:hypothetical protein